MKKSNKILLYGLLASILLILLCLYTHQDEFMIQQKDKLSESKNRDKHLDKMPVSIKEDIEKGEHVVKSKVEEKKTEQPKMVEIPKNMPTVIEKVKDNKSDELEENRSAVAVERTTFKNKEEIKLKEHFKVEEKKKIVKVDRNLPKEDNKPLVDNKKVKAKELKKEVKKRVSIKSVKKTSKKVKSKESFASIQERIANITNRNISFYKNKSQLTNKSKATLNRVVKILKTVPNAKIIVKGYTDASGKEKTNLWISKERAKSVKRYLGKHGIPLKNIKAKGFGESELLYGDKPYSKLNRRVTIEIKRR